MTKILIDRATVEQALEALEFVTLDFFMLSPISPGRETTVNAITALRAALAEPEQEPAPMPPFPLVSQWKRGCAVCGLGADGKAYGYACPRSDCPTRVTCGGAV